MCRCVDGNFRSQIAPSALLLCLFLREAVIRLYQWPIPLSHGDKWTCMFMHVHMLAQPPASVPYRLSHSRVAERTGKTSWSLPKFPNGTETSDVFWERSVDGKINPLALFPGKFLLCWIRTIRKLCLSSPNNQSFNSCSQVRSVFHLLLKSYLKDCAGASNALPKAIVLLCDY